MKKIIFVNGHMNVGGIEKSLLDLLLNIDKSKYNVDLLLLDGKGDYINRIPSNVNVKCIDGACIEGPFIRTVWKNLKHLRIRLVLYRLVVSLAMAKNKKLFAFLRLILPISKHYDYAIAYRPGLCADVVAYGIRCNKKYCWWHHGECNYSQFEKNNILKTWIDFNRIVAVSDGCKRMLQTIFPVLAGKITKLHNMLCVDQLNMMAGNLSPYDEVGDVFIFVTVSRLYVEKHTENVIRAAAEIIKTESIKFKWYIIGDGILYNQLREEIINRHLEDNVFLLGKKRNPYPYIKYADILIHTSYVEAQCTTVLEGMALGTPCIMTKTKNPQDFTKDGVNCILVNQDVESLVNGILYAMRNKSQLTEITHNANHTVKEYSPQRVVTEFESLIEN